MSYIIRRFYVRNGKPSYFYNAKLLVYGRGITY